MKYLIKAKHIKYNQIHRFSCFGATAEEWEKHFKKVFTKFIFLSIKTYK
jgi:hypothetical protein